MNSQLEEFLIVLTLLYFITARLPTGRSCLDHSQSTQGALWLRRASQTPTAQAEVLRST